MSLKRKVYNSCILLLITYGAETLRLRKRIQLNLRMPQSAVKTKMINVTLRFKKRTEWVREEMHINGI